MFGAGGLIFFPSRKAEQTSNMEGIHLADTLHKANKYKLNEVHS